MHNLLKLTFTRLSVIVTGRSLDSREISIELYFGIREGVDEKEGASIDQSIILDHLSQSWWGRQNYLAIKAVFSSLIFLVFFNIVQ